MSEKIVGYILLVFGIFLIVIALFRVYQVFTGQSKAYSLFNLPGISLDLSQVMGLDLPPEQKKSLDPKNFKTDLVSPEVLNQPLNLFFHILFMGFIANIGFKISSLGVQLLRPIKVNLRESSQVSKSVEYIPKT